MEDDEDEESISNCAWEEVSPPGKGCIHLDTKRRARGKGSNNATSRQVYEKKLFPSSPSPNKHSQHSTTNNSKSEEFQVNNFRNMNHQIASIRPLSQSQYHHRQQQNIMEEHIYHQSYDLGMKGEILPSNGTSLTATMAVTNMENAPPTRLHSTTADHENEILVGVGNTESFLDEIHTSSFTQLGHHESHGGNEIYEHNSSSSVAYAFPNTDLISIG